jgi:hypothetical protein
LTCDTLILQYSIVIVKQELEWASKIFDFVLSCLAASTYDDPGPPRLP